MIKRMILCLCAAVFVVLSGFYAEAADQETYRIAWSRYTGWEPWGYAEHAGIIDTWAKKYGIKIELEYFNAYMESINQYTAGNFDGCVMTNMDALTIPAVGGVDSTSLLVGDYSNGNDGVVTKVGDSLSDLKKQRFYLVELSVSHYLLARGLDMHGLKEPDIEILNVEESEISALFTASRDVKTVVTWNPHLMKVRNVPGAKMVFDSSQIPGEILDLMVVRTNTPDSLKKALVGAWYETMAIMSGSDQRAKDAIKYMADAVGATEAEFRAQLKTTAMYYRADEAAAFARSSKLKETMIYVRDFSFDHGLYGGGKTRDHVGISYPDRTVLGNKNNVKLRFDNSFIQLAAEGKL